MDFEVLDPSDPELERSLQGPLAFAERAPPPPGSEILVASRGGRALARASLHLVEGLRGAPGRSGLIGHFLAVEGEVLGDEAEGPPAGVALLAHACRHLAQAGAQRVLGPMDGSTWASYRLVTERTVRSGPEEPPFFMEPWNPPSYPQAFRKAGFGVRSEYVSAAVRDLTQVHPGRGRALVAITEMGIRIRPIEMDRFEEELADIHRLSVKAFSANPLYSPLAWAPFRDMYARVRPLLDPSLVRMARDEAGRLAGFFFALPDPAGPKVDDRPSRLILKTAAVVDDVRGSGLGTLLIDEPRRLALEKGYRVLIHALMHVDNPSARISRHSGDVFRRYALFEWVP
jgi:GNAT superfamily N-acetyltransferase